MSSSLISGSKIKSHWLEPKSASNMQERSFVLRFLHIIVPRLGLEHEGVGETVVSPTRRTVNEVNVENRGFSKRSEASSEYS